MQLAFIVIVTALAADPGAQYAWPLDLPRVLTSSFAEYRPGRYHMGIDLRTGSIGKQVFAAADGYVSRIRCSPYGYGKAIYLQLEDGNSVVYAHLDDYAPALRDYVRNAQHARKKYEVDLYPDVNELPVSRGQLIAKSGQTGIGVPHLHYEIRDPAGVPINPRLLGIAWPDSGAPVFRGVAVIPLDPETAINGDVLPAILPLRRISATEYIAGPVHVSGPVAFGADIVDPANGGGTRLGVHTVHTVSEEQEIFLLRHDRVSYGNGQDGVVAYHPFLQEHGRFLMQWRWPGNASEIFAQSAADGRFQPVRESDTVTMIAEDFHANRATLTIPIAYVPNAAPPDPPGENSAQGTVDYDYLPEWLVVTARFARAEGEAPVLRARSGQTAEAPFRRIDETTFRAAYVPGEDDKSVHLSVIHPRIEAREEFFIVDQRGNGGPTTHVRGEVQITTSTNTAYGASFIRVGPVEAAPGKTLRALGPAYAIGHPDTPLDDAMGISLPIPPNASDPSRIHVYKQGRKRWEFQATARKDDRLFINARQLGVFAALEDTTPPRIKNIRPRPGQQTASARPRIRATISDAGSGVDGFSATHNGRWLLMAYDPELESLTWEQDEDLPAGEGTVEFVTPAPSTPGHDLGKRPFDTGLNATTMEHIKVLERHTRQMRLLQPFQSSNRSLHTPGQSDPLQIRTNIHNKILAEEHHHTSEQTGPFISAADSGVYC